MENSLGKDMIKMSNEKIPQYHPSYTEKENKEVHEYLEHATAESLAKSIQDFCKAYPGEIRESILANLNQLRKELSQRLDMEERYKKLVACKSLWLQYRNALEVYPAVLRIREKYAEYKNPFSLIHFNRKKKTKTPGNLLPFCRRNPQRI